MWPPIRYFSLLYLLYSLFEQQRRNTRLRSSVEASKVWSLLVVVVVKSCVASVSQSSSLFVPDFLHHSSQIAAESEEDAGREQVVSVAAVGRRGTDGRQLVGPGAWSLQAGGRHAGARHPPRGVRLRADPHGGVESSQ